MLCKEFLVLSLTALSLAACSAPPKDTDLSSVVCPDVGAVTIATDYVNDAEHIHTTISKVRGACLVDDGVIDVDLYVDTVTQNLGGTPETDIPVPVFTAVLDANAEPLDKQLHTLDITLPPMEKVATQTHTVTMRFTMDEADQNPAGYHFVIGFQLSE